MLRPPPVTTRTDTLFPYPTLDRSNGDDIRQVRSSCTIVVHVAQHHGLCEISPDRRIRLQQVQKIPFKAAHVRHPQRHLTAGEVPNPASGAIGRELQCRRRSDGDTKGIPLLDGCQLLGYYKESLNIV